MPQTKIEEGRAGNFRSGDSTNIRIEQSPNLSQKRREAQLKEIRQQRENLQEEEGWSVRQMVLARERPGQERKLAQILSIHGSVGGTPAGMKVQFAAEGDQCKLVSWIKKSDWKENIGQAAASEQAENGKEQAGGKQV